MSVLAHVRRSDRVILQLGAFTGSGATLGPMTDENGEDIAVEEVWLTRKQIADFDAAALTPHKAILLFTDGTVHSTPPDPPPPLTPDEQALGAAFHIFKDATATPEQRLNALVYILGPGRDGSRP